MQYQYLFLVNKREMLGHPPLPSSISQRQNAQQRMSDGLVTVASPSKSESCIVYCVGDPRQPSGVVELGRCDRVNVTRRQSIQSLRFGAAEAG
jgi:hypothetical protein